MLISDGTVTHNPRLEITARLDAIIPRYTLPLVARSDSRSGHDDFAACYGGGVGSV